MYGHVWLVAMFIFLFLCFLHWFPLSPSRPRFEEVGYSAMYYYKPHTPISTEITEIHTKNLPSPIYHLHSRTWDLRSTPLHSMIGYHDMILKSTPLIIQPKITNYSSLHI